MVVYKRFLPVLLLSGILFVSACTKNEELNDQERARVDEQLIRDYVQRGNLTGVTRDNNSGVWYQLTDTTTYTDSPTVNTNSIVYVRYTGRLLDGSVFDQRTNASGFRVSSTIQGWQIALPSLLGKRGSMRLIIPSRLAFGKTVQPGIPANSVVDYSLSIDSVINAN
ncbi:MAG: FKBP-type peptidyl-prolyl cis-trans isomerase [Mucilaginibacter polytrichastri]|nr:FKBP-type peptidyl-prolyl cis-trans isomerase [Mucilaginibacter polytrichastri]